jgi:hypothetical protein
MVAGAHAPNGRRDFAAAAWHRQRLVRRRDGTGVAVPLGYRAERGGWVPRGRRGRLTAWTGVYMPGAAPVSRVCGSSTAGRLAGMRPARDWSDSPGGRAYERARGTVRRAETRRRFGWSSRLMAMRPALPPLMPPETTSPLRGGVPRPSSPPSKAAPAFTAQVRHAGHGARARGAVRRGGGGAGRRRGRCLAREAGLWTARPPLRRWASAMIGE